jgi:hypothetical protein
MGAPVPLRIAEPTGRYRRSLRRYRFSGGVSCTEGAYCNASVDIGDVTDPAGAHGDNWPHDDQRWPSACEFCGQAFLSDDEWQRNDNQIYRLPDGAEFVFRHSFGRAAPAGSMVRASWYDDFTEQAGESWIIALPDGGEWITTQSATGGGYWTVTGTPPGITATPSIWHNSPAGWHGFVRDGHLVDA